MCVCMCMHLSVYACVYVCVCEYICVCDELELVCQETGKGCSGRKQLEQKTEPQVLWRNLQVAVH